MLFVASITTLPASAAPFAAATSPAARPGTANKTASAPVSASPTVVTGPSPGPVPEPVREPYTTSCPAVRHRRPSVPPMRPVPMTAIFMLASKDPWPDGSVRRSRCCTATLLPRTRRSEEGAVTEDWLKEGAGDLEATAAIDTTVAHQARIYDYWLDGKDNFAVDREAAEQAIAAYPAILRGVRAQRAFLARAVRYLAEEAGIRQFLDIGTGIPTANNTHEVAQ